MEGIGDTGGAGQVRVEPGPVGLREVGGDDGEACEELRLLIGQPFSFRQVIGAAKASSDGKMRTTPGSRSAPGTSQHRRQITAEG